MEGVLGDLDSASLAHVHSSGTGTAGLLRRLKLHRLRLHLPPVDGLG